MEGAIELPDGGSLSFEDVGDGPVVTLLHPGLWDRRTWDPQVGPQILDFICAGMILPDTLTVV